MGFCLMNCHKFYFSLLPRVFHSLSIHRIITLKSLHWKIPSQNHFWTLLLVLWSCLCKSSSILIDSTQLPYVLCLALTHGLVPASVPVLCVRYIFSCRRDYAQVFTFTNLYYFGKNDRLLSVLFLLCPFDNQHQLQGCVLYCFSIQNHLHVISVTLLVQIQVHEIGRFFIVFHLNVDGFCIKTYCMTHFKPDVVLYH